jgi:translation initiation factor IF-3
LINNYQGVKIAKFEHFTRTNERIRISPLFVVDEDGTKLGSISKEEALSLARQKGLDLVEINPTAHPPICKIMDFGKYKYDQAKKVKEQKARSKEIELKEIRLTAKIGEHDLSYKAEQTKDWLNKEYKVRVNMRLRGRENIFANKAIENFDRFAEIAGVEYESPPKKSGNVISANIAGFKKDKK